MNESRGKKLYSIELSVHFCKKKLAVDVCGIIMGGSYVKQQLKNEKKIWRRRKRGK